MAVPEVGSGEDVAALPVKIGDLRFVFGFE
jgi:hypothetical protein